ncbi:hypothetical protein D3C87_1749210 [compost metagenome]
MVLRPIRIPSSSEGMTLIVLPSRSGMNRQSPASTHNKYSASVSLAARLSNSGLDMTIMPYSTRLKAMSRRLTTSLPSTISSIRLRCPNMVSSSFATRMMRSPGLGRTARASNAGSRKMIKGSGACSV